MHPILIKNKKKQKNLFLNSEIFLKYCMCAISFMSFVQRVNRLKTFPNSLVGYRLCYKCISTGFHTLSLIFHRVICCALNYFERFNLLRAYQLTQSARHLQAIKIWHIDIYKSNFIVLLTGLSFDNVFQAFFSGSFTNDFNLSFRKHGLQSTYIIEVVVYYYKAL